MRRLLPMILIAALAVLVACSSGGTKSTKRRASPTSTSAASAASSLTSSSTTATTSPPPPDGTAIAQALRDGGAAIDPPVAGAANPQTGLVSSATSKAAGHDVVVNVYTDADARLKARAALLGDTRGPSSILGECGPILVAFPGDTPDDATVTSLRDKTTEILASRFGPC